MVSIEDARFYEHSGVDFEGIGRALVKDILSQSAAQGGSTITEQFVKNALAAQGSRTLFQKFREAALAYRLERHWSKDKILTEYLNTIYFGEGAYGIEAAARTYFGDAHPGCGTTTEPCAVGARALGGGDAGGDHRLALRLRPEVLSPKTPSAAATWSWKRCTNRATSPNSWSEGTAAGAARPGDIEPPTLDSKAPYFTSWMRQQLVDRYGAAKAFFGGLKVKTTLDLRLQGAAEEAVNSYLGYLPPTASVVVLDNHNAGVKAMVGGPDFEHKPFNLATHGHRQPGSSIKPFTLVTALEQGISPYTIYESAPQEFPFGKNGKEIFVVTNDEEAYLGSCDIVCATTNSDNSIYAQLALEGLKGKTIADRTRSIAATIHKMGYRDPISTNPAMVLGGLKLGVTPLEWTYAYMTLANNGDRVSGTLAPVPGDSPVAFTAGRPTRTATRSRAATTTPLHDQVISEETAEEAKSILETVVSSGTGTNADIGASGQWGKTGTTENNGDAWFCGATEEVTACVWVGYADIDHVDGNALQRRAGDGRHLPGPDLGQRRLRLGRDQGRTGGRKGERREARLRERRRRGLRTLRSGAGRIRSGTRNDRTGARRSRARSREAAPEAEPRRQPNPPPRRNRAVAAAASPPARAAVSRRSGCRRRRSARGARPLW